MTLSNAEQNLDLVNELLGAGSLLERFDEVSFVSVDGTREDLSFICFLDGSSIFVDIASHTAEIG